MYRLLLVVALGLAGLAGGLVVSLVSSNAAVTAAETNRFWDYQVVSLPELLGRAYVDFDARRVGSDDLGRALSERGAAGWELVLVDTKGRYVFKREKAPVATSSE